MNFYKVPPHTDMSSPEIHEWLAEVDGLYLYVLKNTDRWTSGLPAYTRRHMVATPSSEVPAHIRQKAGQRLGGARTARRRT